MKGYFGIGVEGISKATNVGTLLRTAHAFGAAFVFTVRAQYDRREGVRSDTSDTPLSVPTYHFAGLEDFRLPLGCRLVGVEITEDAIALPSFRHPRQAAYILGGEREGLSPELQELLSLGRHAPRPVAEGAPTEPVPLPVFGDPIYKRKHRNRLRKAEAQK
jgi:tRNA G18 (ribose-2'-O)-methylase SpoU